MAKSGYYLRHVSPHGKTQLPDFHEIQYLSIFLKPAEKIQVSPKYDKNDG